MDNITGEFGDVGKMVCLFGGPRRRGPEKGLVERVVICEKGKLVGFQKESEMANCGVSCKEFTIKGGILGFG